VLAKLFIFSTTRVQPPRSSFPARFGLQAFVLSESQTPKWLCNRGAEVITLSLGKAYPSFSEEWRRRNTPRICRLHRFTPPPTLGHRLMAPQQAVNVAPRCNRARRTPKPACVCILGLMHDAPRSWAKRRKWGAVAYAAAQKPEVKSPKSATWIQSRALTIRRLRKFITRVGDLGSGVGYCNKTV